MTTDIGTTKRKKMTNRLRLQVFERSGGICPLCSRRIEVGEAWQVEHTRALELGGDDAIENMTPAHIRCHMIKTGEDHRRAAKAKRSKAKHIGAHQSRNPMPGGRRSKWKKRMDGTVVLR